LTLLAALAAACAAPGEDQPAPVNCQVSITVIRCPAKAIPSPATLARCRRAVDIWQAMRAGGDPRLLYHASHAVSCAETGAVDFAALERRPIVVYGAGTTTNIVRDYGLNLHLHLRQVPTKEQPIFVFDWDGSWSDSPQLMDKWEALAVRTFNAASKIPGIVYQKEEEDDDGFVETGRGTDISGLFGRKKKAPPPTEAAPAAADSLAEPDYLHDTTYETTPLQGQWIIRPGGLVIARVALPAGHGDELFLLIHLR